MLEYDFFEAREQNFPNDVAKEKAGEGRGRLYDELLSLADWSIGNTGISDRTHSCLAAGTLFWPCTTLVIAFIAGQCH